MIMEKIKSLSEKRLIVEATVNGRKANFLIDTGASVGLIDRSEKRRLSLDIGKSYPGSLRGAGGEFFARYCNTFAYLKGKPLAQFLVAEISGITESIRHETGIEISGIISLPQMKMAGIQIDANDNLIILE